MECGKIIGTHTWDEVFSKRSVDDKVKSFHATLNHFLDIFFPLKQHNISEYDKRWFNPELRNLHRKKQREYFENRKSEKWVILNKRFRKIKRRAVRNLNKGTGCALPVFHRD